MTRRPLLVYLLFFVSGFPALLYQIVWQRTLFAIYGITVESVTVVVTCFMLGLGLGSVWGGWLSRSRRVSPFMAFGLVEWGIAIFGAVSLTLFERVGELTTKTPGVAGAVVVFGLVIVPTALMGSTLPLLFAALLRASGNVGRTVGLLYFVNTLGSAAACFAAASLTMRVLGQSGSVTLAATINAVLGTIVIVLARSFKAEPAPPAEPADGATTLPLSLAAALVGAAGFIALSYEILWFRAYSFVSGGDARVFAQVLGAYLAGIAVGSFASGRVCRTLAAGDTPKYLRLGALFVMGANIVAFLIVPVVARTVQFWDHAATLPLVAVGAALLGAVLPLVTHIAVGPGERAGAHLSYLYLANIVGSAAGSYVTGSIALDHWPLARIAVALAICGVALGGTMLMATSDTQPGRKRAAVVSLVIAGALVLSVGPLFNDLYERLQLKRGYASFRRFAQIIESKAGVITVSDDGTVYGGGVLDGRFNVGLADDTNWVVRAYALSAVHPAPRDVLMIGLGSGSWAQVVAHNPVLDRLTIAEINRGYLQLLATSPDVRSLLINPKVTVAVADGRRWLRSHADRKFDFVVMNTTWNWRAHASNVLSREFFELVRSRLKPGGIVLYNTTWSREAQATGLSVFPYGLRMINCLFLSDTPITFDRARWKQILASYRIDGRAVFDLSQDSDRQLLDAVVAFDNLEDGESVRRAAVGARVITDDNMGTEWNLGSRQGQ